MSIHDEAEKRYPYRVPFDLFGEAERRSVQRAAFEAGAEWALNEALQSADGSEG